MKGGTHTNIRRGQGMHHGGKKSKIRAAEKSRDKPKRKFAILQGARTKPEHACKKRASEARAERTFKTSAERGEPENKNPLSTAWAHHQAHAPLCASSTKVNSPQRHPLLNSIHTSFHPSAHLSAIHHSESCQHKRPYQSYMPPLLIPSITPSPASTKALPILHASTANSTRHPSHTTWRGEQTHSHLKDPAWPPLPPPPLPPLWPRWLRAFSRAVDQVLR
jgi:hypothetical protein